MVPVALMLLAAMGCRPTPRRVTTDDGRCSVVMPGFASVTERASILGGTEFRERTWLLGRGRIKYLSRPEDRRTYILRRGIAPNGTALSGVRLLQEASRMLGLVSTGSRSFVTAAGPATELRVTEKGVSVFVARFYALNQGYCEVTIEGATTDAEVAAFFDTVDIRP